MRSGSAPGLSTASMGHAPRRRCLHSSAPIRRSSPTASQARGRRPNSFKSADIDATGARAGSGRLLSRGLAQKTVDAVVAGRASDFALSDQVMHVGQRLAEREAGLMAVELAFEE